MSVEVTVDMSEVTEYIAQLGRVPAAAKPRLAATVEKGAHNIKTQMVSEMGASGSFGHLAGAIHYEMKDDNMSSEIGMVKTMKGTKRAPRRGGNIAYFGTYKGGGTVPDPAGALEAEIPNFEKWVLDAVGDLF